MCHHIGKYISLELFCFVNLTSRCSLIPKGGSFLLQFLPVLPTDVRNAWEFTKCRGRHDVWSAMAGVLGFLGTSLVPCSAISRQLLEWVGCLNGLGNGDAHLYTFPLIQCSAFQGLFLPVLCCVAA